MKCLFQQFGALCAFSVAGYILAVISPAEHVFHKGKTMKICLNDVYEEIYKCIFNIMIIVIVLILAFLSTYNL